MLYTSERHSFDGFEPGTDIGDLESVVGVIKL